MNRRAGFALRIAAGKFKTGIETGTATIEESIELDELTDKLDAERRMTHTALWGFIAQILPVTAEGSWTIEYDERAVKPGHKSALGGLLSALG